MKTLRIFSLIFAISTSAFADRMQLTIESDRIGAAGTANVYLVKTSDKDNPNGGYGALIPQCSRTDFYMRHASIPKSIDASKYIGKYCKITAKVVKDVEGTGTHLEITAIESAEQAPTSDGDKPSN